MTRVDLADPVIPFVFSEFPSLVCTSWTSPNNGISQRKQQSHSPSSTAGVVRRTQPARRASQPVRLPLQIRWAINSFFCCPLAVICCCLFILPSSVNVTRFWEYCLALGEFYNTLFHT